MVHTKKKINEHHYSTFAHLFSFDYACWKSSALCPSRRLAAGSQWAAINQRVAYECFSLSDHIHCGLSSFHQSSFAQAEHGASLVCCHESNRNVATGLEQKTGDTITIVALSGNQTQLKNTPWCVSRACFRGIPFSKRAAELVLLSSC